MSTGPQDHLFEALDKTFDDGSRRAVLILGAGVHKRLQQRSPQTRDDERWRSFTDWHGMLASVAEHFGLPVVRHEDPASTWESIVVRATTYARTRAAEGGARAPVGTTEEEAFQELARRLMDPPASEQALAELGGVLTTFRDVVSLNIDDAARMAVERSGASSTSLSPTDDLRNLRHTARWQLDGRTGRIWQPHGTATRPETIVLGTRTYGRALLGLHKAWGWGKQAERLYPHCPDRGRWTPESAADWWAARRGVSPFEPKTQAEPGHDIRLTWLDLFLGSDLVFVGTGLDRAETDLWWALHMRHRNLARVDPSARPGTFVLTRGDSPAHLRTGPAGVNPVVFSDWDEAWAMLAAEPTSWRST